MSVSFYGSGRIDTDRYPNALNIVSGGINQAYNPGFIGVYANASGANQGAGVVRYETAVENNMSGYNPSNGRFTAPADGFYYFWANVQGYNTDSTGFNAGSPYISLIFQKNDVTYAVGEFVVDRSTSVHKTPSGSIVIYMGRGDYVTIYANRGCRNTQCAFIGFQIS